MSAPDTLATALAARELLAAAIEAPLVAADKHVPALCGGSKAARRYRAARHRYAQAIADVRTERTAIAYRRESSARITWAYAAAAIISSGRLPADQVDRRNAALRVFQGGEVAA